MSDQLTAELIEQYEFKKEYNGNYTYDTIAIERGTHMRSLMVEHTIWQYKHELTKDEFLGLVKAFRIPKKPEPPKPTYEPFTYETWRAAGRPNPCRDGVEYYPQAIDKQDDTLLINGVWFSFAILKDSNTLPSGKPFGVEVVE